MVPLLISEVLYDGVVPQTEGDEFVEIFNPLGEAVDLAPYRLGDEESRGGGEGMYRFPEGVRILPGGTLVIAKDGGGFYERFGFYPDMEFRGSPGGAGVPDMIRDTFWASGNWALNNDGDEVLLLGGSQLVDSVAYKGGDAAAVGVRGTVSAPEPFSFQRVGEIDSDDMSTDFLVGAPNPGAVTGFPPAPPSPPEPIPLSRGMNAYFGDLHSHTTYSAGSGPPGYAYAVARVNGLHFLGLSDHAYMLDEERWEGMREEAQLATVEGAFVALEGFEWTHQEAGHINVFGSEGFISREDPGGDTLEGFYLWLASQSGAVAQFNHPGSEGDFWGFAYHPQADEVVQLLEVGNGIGSDYRRYESEYLRSLYGGWRVGAANNSDTHTLNWGVETPHRTGVVAQALSREDILAALGARRTFATEDANLALALRAGERWMGSTIPFSDTLSFTIEVADLDGEGVTLTLFDGNLAVASQGFSGAISHAWAIEVPGMAGHFYLVKAEQPDGDVAYSSPLWVVGEATGEAVFLNEVLPAPHGHDWDGDGVAGPDDEWVELFNPGDSAQGLGGWLLDDVADGGSAPYTIPLGMVIEARGFLVLFKGETGVALNDDGDTVRLLRPDGSLADEFGYARSPGYDRSFSRTVDGGGTWTADYPVTMGASNHPPSTPEEWPEEETPPALPQVTVAEARVLGKGTQVILEAQVTVPPGVFSPKTIYLQDETGGILIYLRGGEYPSLKEGDWVRVQGEIWDYYGERELRVEEGNVQFLREGEPPSPLLIATAEVNEEREGLLVEIRGLVTRVEGRSFYIDDGSGEAKAYIREATGIGQFLVAVGESITVVGVVSQYVREAPFEGGYRVLPRYEEDIKGGLALYLPVTGEEQGLGLPPLIWAVLGLLSLGLALWGCRWLGERVLR
ncbi:MAG: lamin tail domain-containing protein [Anaerolineae bacterium]